MIKVGIVGISGYSGLTALKILLNHPEVRVTYVSANNTKGPINEIWPELAGLTTLTCSKFDLKKAVSLCDVVFLAVPHTISMQITPAILKAGIKVIDLSGDYRLKNASQYKMWYGSDHKDARKLGKTVYGLPELYREDIKKANLIANPGCYSTASILALAPFVSTFESKIESIIIDAKSGVSGAGKKASVNFNFNELSGNFKAYKVLSHQHAPEIDLYLKKLNKNIPDVNFVPHLLPVKYGILCTVYITTSSKINLNKIYQLYERFYKTEPFVRICPKFSQPELKHVVGSNFCDIGIATSKNGKMAVITSVIDNLIKGASGQAVQNMNLMFKLKEDTAL